MHCYVVTWRLVTSLSKVHKVLNVFLDITQLQGLPDLLVELEKKGKNVLAALMKTSRVIQLSAASPHRWSHTAGTAGWGESTPCFSGSLFAPWPVIQTPDREKCHWRCLAVTRPSCPHWHWKVVPRTRFRAPSASLPGSLPARSRSADTNCLRHNRVVRKMLN